MTDYIVDIASVTPLASVGDPTVFNQPPTTHIWMEFTVPAEGGDPQLTFDMGSHAFNILTSGGVDKRVYATIKSWGNLRKFMGTGESAVTIEVIADAIVTPTNGVGSYKIREVLRDKAVLDSVVTFYQWSDQTGNPFAIWTGYWRGLERMETRSKIGVLSCRISSLQSKGSLIISDTINQPGSPNAPSDSFGKMVPRAYGNFMTGLNSSNTDRSNYSIFLGYGSRFVEGVIVDQNQSALKLKVRFCKNDGVAASKLVQESTVPDTPFFKGDFWVWLQGANTYAMIDPGSMDVTNDSTETSILVDASPTVYIALRPSGIGSQMASGLSANAYRVLDDDASNFIETTSSDYKVGFEIPSVSFVGIQVQEIGVCWHVKGNGTFGGTRDVQFGIWDDFNSPSAGWLGMGSGVPKLATITGLNNAAEDRNEQNGFRYNASDFDNHIGVATITEFSEGRFIGRDANAVETPLQFFMQVSSASKDGIRLLGCGLIVKAKISLERTRRVTRSMVPRKGYDPQGKPRDPGYGTIQTRPEVILVEGFTPNLSSAANQLTFIATGQFQNDPSGVYDTANAEIRNGAGVAQHLISAVGGMSVNTASGTLGNFTDAKTESVAGEKKIDVSFGPRITTFGDAIEELQKRWPIRLHQEDQIWQCIPNDMNPDQSRYYTKSGSMVKISARKHILDGSVEVSQLPFDKLVNISILNYGHGYGTNRAMRSFRYDNYLSQLQFGQRPEIVVEEPWITCRDLTADPEPAKFLTKFLGRVNARPRLTVNLKLSKDFFDLKRGHAILFDTDMEDVGINCPAYRCGKPNYTFQRAGGAGTNGAFSGTPIFMDAGTTETYFFADQQFPSLTFGIPGGGSYTTVANGWEYYNGTAWTALANVVRNDAGDPLAVFKAAAGVYTVSWDMPNPYDWKKAEFDVGVFADAVGPQYGVRMKYSVSAGTIIGTQQTKYPAKWNGRVFEVTEATRKPGGYLDYPYLDVVLQEVM